MTCTTTAPLASFVRTLFLIFFEEVFTEVPTTASQPTRAAAFDNVALAFPWSASSSVVLSDTLSVPRTSIGVESPSTDSAETTLKPLGKGR